MQIKHILVSVFCFLILHHTQAQNLNLSWARKMNNSAVSLYIRSIAVYTKSVVDMEGNIYAINEYNRGGYTSELAIGLNIRKYDKTGNMIWSKSFGPGVRTQNIVLDNTHHLYIIGYFNFTVDFDPSDSVYNLSPNGGSDVFIQKLDSAGNFVWVKSFGGGGTDLGSSVFVDNRYNVYATGYFGGSGSNLDAFIQKLDSAGNLVWVKSFDGGGLDLGSDIFMDNSYNIYTTGYFSGTIDFDPSDSIYSLSSNGNRDIFVQKLDSSGNFIWTKAMGSIGQDQGTNVFVDNRYNVYTTGYFSDTVDFDPGDSVYNLSSNGSGDVFIQKLDSSGNFVWAKTMGSSIQDESWSIFVDNRYNVYTTGYFGDTTDFDPGDSVYNLLSAGLSSIFLQKLDSSGSFVSAKSFGGAGYNVGNSIIVSEKCAIYISGMFSGTTDFSGGTNTNATHSSPSTTLLNGFITKYTQDYTEYTIVSDTVFACDSYVFRDSTYTSHAELYADTLCGVITTHYLSILQSIETIDTVSACESFVWGNNTYRHTGVYQDTLYRTNTCDSVVALTLSIHSPSTGDTMLVSCDSVRFSGMVYTVSGMYQDTLIGSNGCDSIIFVALTIIDSVDTVVMQEDSRLVARLENAEYQWLDCGNSYAEIEGATNRIFTANMNGEYAVEVRDVCIDTSSCYTIMGLSIEALREHQEPSAIYIYPSPTEGELCIELGQFSQRIFVVVRDVFGRVLQEETISVNTMTNRINTRLETSAGMYYIEVSDEKGNRDIFRIVKQ